MIIKIMPENEEEAKRIRESEHSGITDFFVCGNKREADGEVIDFHEWSGKYPKLIGPLFYYANFLLNEQNVKNNATKSAEAFTPQAQNKPFIKRSKPSDGEIKQLLTAEDITNGADKTLKFTPISSPVQEEELPVEPVAADDESKGAEEN